MHLSVLEATYQVVVLRWCAGRDRQAAEWSGVDRRAGRGEEPQVYFWRTSAGTEVDFVVESGTKLIPIEVKLSATPRAAMASGIRTFCDDLGARAAPGYVIHPGDGRLPLGSHATALPMDEL